MSAFSVHRAPSSISGAACRQAREKGVSDVAHSATWERPGPPTPAGNARRAHSMLQFELPLACATESDERRGKPGRSEHAAQSKQPTPVRHACFVFTGPTAAELVLTHASVPTFPVTPEYSRATILAMPAYRCPHHLLSIGAIRAGQPGCKAGHGLLCLTTWQVLAGGQPGSSPTSEIFAVPSLQAPGPGTGMERVAG